jgi:hypothetical protein
VRVPLKGRSGTGFPGTAFSLLHAKLQVPKLPLAGVMQEIRFFSSVFRVICFTVLCMSAGESAEKERKKEKEAEPERE